MLNIFKVIIISISLITSVSAAAETAADNNPTATIKTNKGSITIQLYPEQAPATVKNFIDYAESGFYSNTIFHRVIKNFMIQGGGFDTSFQRKATNPPIPLEAGNGLNNDRWTVAMARTSDPNSATSQFFINVKTNSNLDRKSNRPGDEGYAVFAEVIEGKSTIRKIIQAPVVRTQISEAQPVKPIIIESVTINKP